MMTIIFKILKWHNGKSFQPLIELEHHLCVTYYVIAMTFGGVHVHIFDRYIGDRRVRIMSNS